MSTPYVQSPILSSGGTIADGPTTAPTLLAVAQASGLVVGTIRPPDVRSSPIASYTLQRSTDGGTTWSALDVRKPATTARWVNAFDASPNFGVQTTYRAITDGGVVTNAVAFIAAKTPTPIAPAGFISSGAFGPYPLLGSDVFIDPASGEAVIGPNGDLLSVNGLELLAQDLRFRLLTTQGELLLHPEYGLPRQRLIGSGQGNPVAEAQLLRAKLVDVLEEDPRVDHVEDVEIRMVAFDAWTVAVTLVAIGVEDAGLQNLVFPYFLPKAA